jgi:DnaK suppressor protein
MDKEFLKSQKAKLLLEKKRLENELKSIETFPQYGNNDEDNSEEEADFFVSSGEDKKMLQLFNDVKTALKKIDDGKYGFCENCQKKIDTKRLEAFPAATTCVKCK